MRASIRTRHPLAGRTVRINLKSAPIQALQDGCMFSVEDWWQNVSGGSWMDAVGNPACIIYGLRGGLSDLPVDNEVVYGKVDYLGYLVHVSELGDEVDPHAASSHDDEETISYDDAVKLLPEGDEIHTLRQAGPVLLGAGMSREQLLEAMRRAPEIYVTGPGAQSLGHGLAIECDGTLFIETKREAVDG